MVQVSEFKSRTGVLSCTPEDVYGFVTDMRNFRNFLPEVKTDKMEFSRDECDIDVSDLGNIKLRIGKRTPFSEVIYNGTLLKMQDFCMTLDINKDDAKNSRVMITISASMNPFMKLMAEKYINKFLEVIIVEMEKFRNWRRS